MPVPKPTQLALVARGCEHSPRSGDTTGPAVSKGPAAHSVVGADSPQVLCLSPGLSVPAAASKVEPVGPFLLSMRGGHGGTWVIGHTCFHPVHTLTRLASLGPCGHKDWSSSYLCTPAHLDSHHVPVKALGTSIWVALSAVSWCQLDPLSPHLRSCACARSLQAQVLWPSKRRSSRRRGCQVCACALWPVHA